MVSAPCHLQAPTAVGHAGQALAYPETIKSVLLPLPPPPSPPLFRLQDKQT